MNHDLDDGEPQHAGRPATFTGDMLDLSVSEGRKQRRLAWVAIVVAVLAGGSFAFLYLGQRSETATAQHEVAVSQSIQCSLAAKVTEQTKVETELRGDVTTLITHDGFDNLVGQLLFDVFHGDKAASDRVEAKLNHLRLTTHLTLPSLNVVPAQSTCPGS